MRLYDEIFKNADGGATERLVVVPKGGGYFQGVKSVGEFSREKLLLYFASGAVEIVGEELSIKKYYDGDLQVRGRIFSLALVNEQV